MRLRISLYYWLWLLLATVSVAACSAPSHTIKVPLPNAVSEITVSVKRGDQSKRAIRDRIIIERVIKLIAENNSGWTKGLFTFPTPSASAVLSSEDGSVHLVLWFGPDWMGAAATIGAEHGNYLWHVRPEVEFELRRLFEISA